MNNQPIRLCRNCQYYVPPTEPDFAELSFATRFYPRCSNPALLDGIDGDYQGCRYLRLDGGCGPSGTMFEERTSIPPAIQELIEKNERVARRARRAEKIFLSAVTATIGGFIVFLALLVAKMAGA